ncbi:MAG: hypothetical protein JWQ32_1870 [Marmoricola sp.]|nr:hypothetical protein [Marmoricola sp.]
MAKFRAVDKDGKVLGEVKETSTWGAIIWAQGEFRSKKPRVKFLSLERHDEDGWKFVFSTKGT